MILKKLSLVNFKNYEQLTLEFSGRINCFVGHNGAGKTNLLDAIYYLSMCKSYFNTTDLYSLRYNEEYFVIQGEYVTTEGRNEEILCSYRKNSRKIVKRNKKDYERLSEHIGLIPVVMITPNDGALITEGSEQRRRLIDTIIVQYNKTYLDQLIQYNRLLQQRNRLLKDVGGQPNGTFLDMFDIYDEQLAILGKNIYNERKSFLEFFRPLFIDTYRQIAGNNETVEIQYQSQLHDKDMLLLLQENFARDRQMEFTTAGIHKDDLLLLIDNMPAKRIASQGQQKTFLVALKLAEYHMINQHSQKSPLLLLDDLFDKLDHQRVQRLVELTSHSLNGQIFITDTEIERINPILNQVSNGHFVFRIDKNQAVWIQ